MVVYRFSVGALLFRFIPFTFLAILFAGMFSGRDALAQVRHEQLLVGHKLTFVGGAIAEIKLNSPASVASSLSADPRARAASLTATVSRILRPHRSRLGMGTSSSLVVGTRAASATLAFFDHQVGDADGGIRVFGDQVTARLTSNGSILSLTTSISPTSAALNLVPTLAAEEARVIAERLMQVAHPTVQPQSQTPVLMLVDPSRYSHQNVPAALQLAWMIEIAGTSSTGREVYRRQIFINAHTGADILQITLHTNDRVVFDCSIADRNNGSCFADHVTVEGHRIGRSEEGVPAGTNFRFGFQDVDKVFDGVGQARQYFLTRHERDGANRQGGISDGRTYPVGDVRVFTYIDTVDNDCPNAYYDGTALNFCAGFGESFDVVAHEYAHALTQFSANLIYRAESGALNEAFSDIFGNGIDHWVSGVDQWVLGRNLPPGLLGGALRDMASPERLKFFEDKPYPDRFNSPNFYCGTRDEGGVHVNSSVLNKGAYLIAAGGSFNECTIKGIGREKMEKVAFRALTVYLQPSSKFNQAYLAFESAAIDLFGPESQEVATVRKALIAVEMHQPGRCSSGQPSTLTCATFPDPVPATPTLAPTVAPTPAPTVAPTATPPPPAPETVKLIGYEIAARRGVVILSLTLANVQEVRAVEAVFDPAGPTQKKTLSMKAVGSALGRVLFVAKYKVPFSKKQKRRRVDAFVRTLGEISGLQLTRLAAVTARR